MEIAANAQNKVENATSEIHKSPIKDNVDNGGGEIASNNKPIENNDVEKVMPKSRKMTKIERMSQENAALLKELGVDPNGEEADSGRRRTRSQARGITAPPAHVEEKPKRGRKSKEEGESKSNKKPTPQPSGESGQKRGRGRPPKNVPSPKKLKENDKVVQEKVTEPEPEKNEEPSHSEVKKQEVETTESKVEEDVKKEEEKVSPMEATEPEKPKEEPEPTPTTTASTDNTEEKTNGEEISEKEKSENCSDPQPMETKPSEGSETLTTPNEN